MTQTFTDNVLIQDSDPDAVQLAVQAAVDQAQPMQTWLDSAENPMSQVAKDGRHQVGDLDLGTPDALIEANANLPGAAKPARGVQSLGRYTGALTDLIAWAVHELELLGEGGVSGLQTALRAKLTHSNTGDSTAAELRAADVQAINESGDGETPVGQATGIRATASNATGANLNKAVAVEAAITNDTGGNLSAASAIEVVPPVNNGSIGSLYGLRIPNFDAEGILTDYASAQFGDELELGILEATPPKTPPGGFVKLYPKLRSGVPHLYAKGSDGTEHDLSTTTTTATAKKAEPQPVDLRPQATAALYLSANYH